MWTPPHANVGAAKPMKAQIDIGSRNFAARSESAALCCHRGDSDGIAAQHCGNVGMEKFHGT